MKIKFSNLILLSLIVFATFSVSTANSSIRGGVLYITPPTESYGVGSIFSSDIMISSPTEPLNAIEGILRYSRDTIELLNISKSGSIISVWVNEPTFSNKNGVIEFSGGIPSPGFSGSVGKILTLTFRAINDGPATITWEKAIILANDGKGTEISASTENASHIINRLSSPSGGNSSLPESSTLYVLIGIIVGIILLTFFISKTLFTKKIIRENLEHLDKDIREDLGSMEKDLENNPDRSKIAQNFRNMREGIEKDIDDIEKKL